MCNAKKDPPPQDFVHLHAHTTYSIQDAHATPSEYAAKAGEMGFRAAAITDHGRLGGVPEFVESCRDGGVKPIVGCELYVTHDRFAKGAAYEDESGNKRRSFHLTVLAKNDAGYRNLLALADIGAREGYYHNPRVDFDAISRHHEGLIVMTGCLGSEVNQAILRGDLDEASRVMDRYHEVFGEDYYLEMHNHKMEQQTRVVLPALMELNTRHGLVPVAANDVHYLQEMDWRAHQLQKDMSTISSGKAFPYESAYGSRQFWLKDTEEMMARFARHPEMVTNTLGVAEKVEDFLRLDTRHLLPEPRIPDSPAFRAWKEKTLPHHPVADAYLAYLAFEGLKRRGLHTHREYAARLKQECENIWAMGVTAYFLVQVEVTEYMKGERILFGVRGSGVGSLLNYCLDISTVDPLPYDLMFERFLNPGRGTQYDVDFKAYPSKDYLKEFGSVSQADAVQALRGLWAKAKADDPSLLPHGPDVSKEIWVLEQQLLATYLYEIQRRELTFAHNEPQLWSAWLLGLCPDRPEAPMRVKKVASLPDIDTDIDSRYRDKVILWCKDRFGEANVAPICNYGTLKARAAVKGALKTSEEFKRRFAGDYLTKIDEITKLIPEKMLSEEDVPEDDEDAGFDQIKDAIAQNPEFGAWNRKFPTEIGLARKVLGRVATQGVHASGVLIASEPIARHAPIEKSKKRAKADEGEDAKDEFVAAYDMGIVERVGLVKWDFLGLSMWTKIAVCLDLLRDDRGVEVDFDAVDKLDKRIFELYRSGRTSTLFQAGGKGMKGALREVGVTNIEDLIAVFALYRPGPMEFISEYAQGKKNPSTVKYSDPALKGILGVTYGIPVYQEQAMKMAREMADFNWLDTQAMQKSVSKKDPEKFKKSWGLFERKARDMGVSEPCIAELAHRLERFSGYAFNKAHSASYADLSFKTAYLRAYYPAEWMAASLYVDRDKKDVRTKARKVDAYLEECAQNGIKVRKPDVNASGMEVRIVGGEVVLPLVHLPGVGGNAAQVAALQPYESFRDLMFKARPNKTIVKALAEGQGLRCFREVAGKAVDEVLETFDELVKERAADDKRKKREEAMRYRVDSPLAQARSSTPYQAPERTKRPPHELAERPLTMMPDLDIDDLF